MCEESYMDTFHAVQVAKFSYLVFLMHKKKGGNKRKKTDADTMQGNKCSQLTR